MKINCKVCRSPLDIEQVSRKHHIYDYICLKCGKYECEGSLSYIWTERFYTENYVLEEDNHNQTLIYKMVDDDFYDNFMFKLSSKTLTFKYKRKVDLEKLEEWVDKYSVLF